MALSLWYYLFPEDADPLRLSQRLVEGLTHGNDAMPQYAGTRQRIMGVVVLNEDGKPDRVDRTYGSIWTFNEDGEIREGLHEAVAEAMNSIATPSPSSTVVSIRPQLSKKRLAEKFRWEPTPADINRVIQDLWPKQKSDRLKEAKGVSQRKPPLTFEAKHALDKISAGFWEVAREIEALKEPGLRGFAFEAGKRSGEDLEYRHLYAALAASASDRLELLRRQKSGKGIWYAVIEVIMTRPEGFSETIRVIYERCEGRDAAVVATRKLLVQHAELFNSYTELDASVMTDLEWEVMAFPD